MKIFLCLGTILLLLLLLTASVSSISSIQQTNEMGHDCMGQRRPGINIHDLLYDDDQIRKLNYPTHCCDDYYIRFTHSSIPTLATSSFGTRPNYIVDISMDNTNISKILPGTFTGLSYLNCLDLSHNNISFIQYGIFNGLKRLYVLNLANNNIKQIFDNAFENIPLTKIFLQNNILSFLDDNLFSSLKNSLTLINLSKNILKNINSTFVGMNSLMSLNLNHNYIKHVDLANIYSTEIYLRNNSVSRILAVRKTTRIIDLSENNIQSIEDLGSGLINSTIAKLYLSRNTIQFSQNSLVGMYNLTHLYLDNNNVRNISNTVFKDLKSLISLDLSHNDITQFQYGTFDHVSDMQFLNISFNKFTELQLHVFSPLQKLRELDFRNNQITELDTGSFLYHCPSLRKINVDGNLWKCRALTNIVKHCQTQNVEVVRGNSIDFENVRGIACDNDDSAIKNNSTKNNVTEKNVEENNIVRLLENSSFFNFFGKDFKKSNFFEYLENLNSNNKKPTDAIDLNSTSFYNFFNKDYKQSNLFKYFENLPLRDHEVSETPVEYFHFLFIFCVSLVAILVLIFITVFTISILLLKKGSSKSNRNVSNQDNVELL